MNGWRCRAAAAGVGGAALLLWCATTTLASGRVCDHQKGGEEHTRVRGRDLRSHRDGGREATFSFVRLPTN